VEFYERQLTANSCIALCNSRNAVSFSSASTTKRSAREKRISLAHAWNCLVRRGRHAMLFQFDSSREQSRMGSYFCKIAECKPPSFAKHRRYGMNTERLRTLALNLNRTSPRSPYTALGNVFPAVAARLVDKCRAELLGQSGSYSRYKGCGPPTANCQPRSRQCRQPNTTSLLRSRVRLNVRRVFQHPR
jgi:hypothetical protein